MGSVKKRKTREVREINIPTSIFHKTKLSVLESIVFYLKHTKGLTLHEIALALDRDERNIWTVYNRAKKKI